MALVDMARPWAARLIACLWLGASAGSGPCKEHTVDFILLDGDSLSKRIEDDIAGDLAQVGITVNTRLLPKDDFNTAMTSGDFNLCFTESWGPPYDPHSYAASWFVADEAHYKALDGLQAPNTKAVMEQKVTDVLKVEGIIERQAKWAEILQALHEQAISNPMWSRTMPAVMNNRLSGYVPGQQQYEYPVHHINVLTGARTLRVAAGSQQGLFGKDEAIPRNDPHSYRPNEFFINDWIYEGLVGYGKDGEIVPQLARAWTVSEAGSGQEYRFELRSGVTFHDGSACDCMAVKMTFDHALAPELLANHNWYQLPAQLQNWECQGETFVLTTKDVYYPLLQELSFIRPIRVLSPNCYNDGPSSSASQNNSCPVGWNEDLSNAICGGVKCSAGTGPWKLVSTTLSDDGKKVAEMSFEKHDGWWGARGNVEAILVKGYTSDSDVKADLKGGVLDMAVGGGVLTPADVKDLAQNHAADFHVVHGPPLMNSIVVMNSNKAPTDDLQLRKVIMHAVNKALIVQTELAGSRVVAHSLFPKEAPYCDVDLTPRWDYDLEKAELLNCPEAKEEDGGIDLGLILGLTFGIGIPLLIIVGVAAFFLGRRRGYQQFAGGAGGAGGAGNSAQA